MTAPKGVNGRPDGDVPFEEKKKDRIGDLGQAGKAAVPSMAKPSNALAVTSDVEIAEKVGPKSPLGLAPPQKKNWKQRNNKLSDMCSRDAVRFDNQ